MASAAFHRRWYVYAFWIAIYPLGAMLALLSGALSGSGASGGVSLPLLEVVILVPLIAAWWAFIGYYLDAKHQRANDADWVPTWWLWMLSHFILTPALTAPVYLVVRTLNTGTPFGTWEDAGRWVGARD